MYQTDAARWRALSIRDPNANNHFVYTVKSTHVYCRPTCPARLARRANVGFCTTPAEAAALGFRACKRCKPDVAETEDPQEKAVTKACELIEDALKQGDAKALRLQDLAKNVGLTPRYFHKIFKDKTGATPSAWVKAKMDEKEGETRTPSLTLDSPSEIAPLNMDTFDFNELVDFNADSGQGFDGVRATTITDPAMLSLDGFDEGIDANTTTMCTWDTFAPDYIDAGFRIGNHTMAKWADPSTIPEARMTKVSATFEQDAALILGIGFGHDLNDDAYAPGSNTHWRATM
jgi:methylphosphotriester-DNA--protein-cysteine methyltransferase